MDEEKILIESHCLVDEKVLRDGLSEEEALLRVRAGKPDAYYIERADHILFNNGNLAVLQKQFRQIIAE